MKKVIRFLPAIIYAALIFYFSSMSSPPQPELLVGIQISSVVKHFAEYFIFGLLLMYAFWEEKKSICYAIATGLIYAATDEFHQFFVLGRMMDMVDWLIDAIAIITSVMITKWLLKKK